MCCGSRRDTYCTEVITDWYYAWGNAKGVCVVFIGAKHRNEEKEQREFAWQDGPETTAPASASTASAGTSVGCVNWFGSGRIWFGCSRGCLNALVTSAHADVLRGIFNAVDAGLIWNYNVWSSVRSL